MPYNSRGVIVIYTRVCLAIAGALVLFGVLAQ
jgi:hypothetical protein